jgi:hypothetical protein
MNEKPKWQQARAPRWWAELLVTILGLASFALAFLFYDQAFPTGSLDLNLSRSQVENRLQTYLQSRGYTPEGFEFALTFDESFWGSIYLQRTLGVSRANEMIRAQRLPIWSWQGRWFKPLQKEEFTVSVSPDGEVLGFSHTISETDPGPKLSQEDARIIAEKYLIQDRRWNLADWERVIASSEDKPGGRADHHFEWKRRDFHVGEGELRISVDVYGDRIGEYTYWIKAPEAFQRGFNEANSRAGFFGTLSYLIGFVGICIFIGSAGFWMLQRNADLDRKGIIVAIIVGGVIALSALNNFSLNKFQYETAEDYSIFWIYQWMSIAIGLWGGTAVVVALWMGARVIAKSVWRYQDKILPRYEHLLIVLARSGWRGLMMSGIMFGYVVIFYLVVSQFFNGWIPMDAPSSNLFATPFPFLSALAIGVFPAATEELVFRLAGISLVLYYTRNRFLALLIPGALWAFAHLGYITDPVYLRGIELTIAAFFIEGLIFYFFDLTTTMIAHCTYNAGLLIVTLLRSNDPYFVANGVIAIIILLVPIILGTGYAILRKIRGGKFVDAKMRIDVATSADESALTALGIGSANWSELLQRPSFVAMCLRAENQVVGVIGGELRDDKVGEVTMLYVEPVWRKRYWASILVDELAWQFKERGAESIETQVVLANKMEVKFWAVQAWPIAAWILGTGLMTAPRLSLRQRVAKRWNDWRNRRTIRQV